MFLKIITVVGMLSSIVLGSLGVGLLVTAIIGFFEKDYSVFKKILHIFWYVLAVFVFIVVSFSFAPLFVTQ